MALEQASVGDLGEFFARPQFSIPQGEKDALLLPTLQELTEWHRERCDGYARILRGEGFLAARKIADFPALPVSLFKTNRLASITEEDVFKTMTSSGTTGSAVSRIILDRHTAELQSRALTVIMRKVLGPDRMPMIIIDTPNVVKNRTEFSARGAGVLGMLPYGRRHFYALNDEMELDIQGLRDFLDRHTGKPILIFGFTFMVWKYLLQQLRATGESVDLSDATLIHSGGWKKLADEAVGNTEFKSALAETTGMKRIHNFYGMVEQVGSVFLEGSDGWLYPSNFSEVIVRNPATWEEAAFGEPGVIEVLSVLPRSYPGHVLLTEDLGVVHGVSDGTNGWHGKQLEVLGRLPKSELRGCSDTHAYSTKIPA